MIPNFKKLDNKFLGSSLSLLAHGWVGARVTSLLLAHFALQNTASNSAEKKNRPREGVAEGGCGGEFHRARANTNGGQPHRPARSEQNPAKKFSFPFGRKKSARANQKL